MKIKKWLKKLPGLLVIIGLVLGLTSSTPTVNAKTTYKTLAYDKKLETVQDFEGGEFKNSKIKETTDGIEIGITEGDIGEYITPVVQAPFGATHIGLHWKEKEAGKNLVTVYVRTSNNGQNFGEWVETSVELDETRDDIKNEEIFSALVGVEKDVFAQAKIEFFPNNGKLKNLTFTFINSGEESKQIIKELSLAPKSIAEGTGTLKTSPHGINLNVISREDWGADESYRFDRKGKEEWPRSYHGTRKIVTHHTAVASSNGETILENNKAEVRAIYYYHAITQGWGDIGYNALVDASGNVYEGRYGTHDVATRSNPIADQIMTLDVETGHTAGYNQGSFGVSAMGDFTNFDIPASQRAGLENVLAYVADSRGINTQGNTDFRRYDGTWHSDLNNVIAHRDATVNACPGDRLYSQMTSIITNVDNVLDNATSNLSSFSATLNGNPISGTNVGLGMINFNWSTFTNATQYQYVLERVYGTPGVLNDSEPWKTAWLNPENDKIKSTSEANAQIEAETLVPNSNYVFYVRALDASGLPISTVSHVNFFKDSSVIADVEKPTVTINSPVDGANLGSGVFPITAIANDNIAVTNMKLYIDGKQVATSATGSISYNWNTKKVAIDSHTIKAEAYDAVGNKGETSITVNRVK